MIEELQSSAIIDVLVQAFIVGKYSLQLGSCVESGVN